MKKNIIVTITVSDGSNKLVRRIVHSPYAEYDEQVQSMVDGLEDCKEL